MEFFKKNALNKRALILSLGLALFFILTPSYSAQAYWWDEVIGGLVDVVATIFTLPLWIFIFPIVIILAFVAPLVSFIFFIISLFFLNSAATGWIISLPLTHGGIVDQGLAATTALVNLGFILVLVIIALATILRRESYGLKKLLPRFLAIVLLINFVPVISGAIIDIANIITKAFLDFDIIQTFLQIFNPLQGDINRISAVVQGVQGEGDWIQPLVAEIRSIVGLSGIIQRILTGVLISSFGLFAAFTFFLYFILFLLRYIIIWILVILAPIAWFCLILPGTQKFFKMWWDYFIQWAFIGAIAGFFLKLGGIAVSAFSGGFGIITTPNACPPGQIDCWQNVVLNMFGFVFETFNSIFLYVAVLIFLIIGFILSLKLSGGGTEMVLNWGKKGLDATGKWARGKAWEQTGQRWLASQAQRATTDKSGLLYKMAGTKWGGEKNPFAIGTRFLGRTGLAAGSGAVEDKIDKAKGDFKKKYGGNTDLLARSFSKDLSYPERIAAGLRLAEEGNFSKLSEDDRNLVLNDALSYSPTNVKDILIADPSAIDRNNRAANFVLKRPLDQEVAGNDKKEASEEMMRKIIRVKDIENYDDSFFKGQKERQEFAILNWGPEKWKKIATNSKFSENMHKELNETAEEIERTRPGEIAKSNAAYLKFRASDPVGIVRYGEMKGAGTINEIKFQQAKNAPEGYMETPSGLAMPRGVAPRQTPPSATSQAGQAAAVEETPRLLTKDERQGLGKIIPGAQKGLIKERDALVSEITKFQRGAQAAEKILEQTTNAIKSLRETQSKITIPSDISRITNEISALEKRAMEHGTALEKSKLSLEGLKTRLKTTEGILEPYKEQVKLKKEAKKTIEGAKKQVEDLKKAIKK